MESADCLPPILYPTNGSFKPAEEAGTSWMAGRAKSECFAVVSDHLSQMIDQSLI